MSALQKGTVASEPSKALLSTSTYSTSPTEEKPLLRAREGMNGFPLVITNAAFLARVAASAPTGSAPWVCHKTKAENKEWGGYLYDGRTIENPEENTYFTISTMCLGSKSRKSCNFSALTCVVLDDIGSKVEQERLQLIPSWKLETSPGNFQWGYLLDKPITDAETANLLVQKIINAGLSDPGATSPTTRYMRLPVGVNNKDDVCKANGGKPFLCCLTEWEPNRVFSREELITGLGLDKEPQHKVSTVKPTVISEGEGRNTTFFGVACNLLRTLSEPVAWKAFCDENIARCNPPMDENELRKIFKSAVKTQNRNAEVTRPIASTVSNVINALRNSEFCGIEIRFDEFRDCMMLAEAGSSEWREVTDADFIRLRVILESRNFKIVSRELIRDAASLVADENRFDSAKYWLERLQWDGVERIDSFLSTYFSAENTPYVRAVSRYLWTAMAGRVLIPGCKVDMVPILTGPQGTKKSSGVAELVPHPDQFCEISFGEKDNDLSRRMRGTLVAELAELQGLRTRELEFIKAFITRQYEKWTPKYKEFDVTFPRRLVFVGTTNSDEFLDDETGNRRWLPVSVGEVNVDGIRSMRLLLWAEARKLFLAEGVAYKVAENLATDIHTVHTITDEWKPLIVEWLRARDCVGDEEAITGHELMAKALEIPKERMTKAYQMRVAKILKTLDFRRVQRTVNGHNTSVWVRVGYIHLPPEF